MGLIWLHLPQCKYRIISWGLNQDEEQIHVYFRMIPFHSDEMPLASFGCCVYRIAMQIHQQYQFHVVSFTCIIQKDLRLPVLCTIACSTLNKNISGNLSYARRTTSRNITLEKMLLHAEFIEVSFLKHSANFTCLQFSYTNALGCTISNKLKDTKFPNRISNKVKFKEL